ncbi:MULTISPECIES: lipid A export permease/ATP-binding protein MsbA [unclassified Pseudoalteromonas]|mgnify:CR=1 FL=1|uniref:lipid A export permease/ATP-binding protein MsbA n=1 Tax=unclassified Pseudoalteromonas TaxID=194690 RepID=UPI0011084D9E|nr:MULTISPECIES: lipid A export permease/ATP-binding protein MsbA [unclassified Pseudoalteromonas]TMN82974.1 lipid A export permease/ATP-binding protein MsbA [Pseudoalteromonas sp. S410]TMN90213.1 lipid A export permease/ATP-binding protein MsbA [Pseudoalteromonas sp. S408]TMN99246.1 lipid A export permease/ATP-binding protein MsbA [Pseudoalteromonas sp. S409]TMO00775.1 lipid A export permease/ATP-binding protein MsbA [Pseudoalteromonas sp. S407]TMO11169.1 lipid A export permease/ATP-binding p|tara:strand:- start:2512 stop:4257 length:1746 start_codon:yes stop_codon:yes gene_type:complete
MDQSTTQIYKRLISYVGAFKSVAVVAVVGMIGYSGMDALFIQLMKPFIDEGLNQRNTEVLKYAPFVVIALVIGRGIFNFMSSYCLSYVGSQVVRSLRQELFDHILHLPVSFHDKNSTGDLISKITFDTEQVQQAITKALLIVVREGAFVIFLLALMFYTSWQLSLIFLVIIPLVALIVAIVSKRFRHISKNIQSAMGQVTRSSEQMLSGHKVIHGFGGQEQEVSKFSKINNHNRQQRIKMDATKALSVSIIQILAASAMAVILWVVSMPSMIDTISSGDFVVLISSMMMLLRPLKQLANVNSDMQRGISAAQSIFLILDENIEKDTGTVSVKKAKGLIEVKNVTFKYPTKDEPVLNDLTLTIEAGQSIALVGRSGSGKSTISNLLPRYYDLDLPSEILLDGVPLSDYKLTDLRRQFALVSQQVVLFNDTIANNICYGIQREISETELQKVAKQAHVWEFVKDLPEKLNTMVGENGVMLSGGQRQRIAIARAILKDAPILILDEATSALDTESEKLIQHALDDLMKDKTSIVIAHRLSTIENSDKIYVIDNGRVIESGDHTSLLSNNGTYSALCKMQFGDHS